LADTPGYTKRFASPWGGGAGRRPSRPSLRRSTSTGRPSRRSKCKYMREQLRRAGTPAPKVIGLDEVSIRKGHTYRIVVSDLARRRPIWFGGVDRSAASLAAFLRLAGAREEPADPAGRDGTCGKPSGRRPAAHAPQAPSCSTSSTCSDNLGEALDTVRKSEYARLRRAGSAFHQGQKYTLLSHKANLTLDGRRALQTLLKANQRLNTAYLLKESFGQLWITRPRAGPGLLRAVEGRPEVAAPHAVPAVRRHD